MDKKGALVLGLVALITIVVAAHLLMPYFLPVEQSMSERMIIVASDVPGEGWESVVATSGLWYDGTVRAYTRYNLTDAAYSEVFPAKTNGRLIYTFLINFNTSADAETAYLNSYMNFADAGMSPYFNADELSKFGDRSFASSYHYPLRNNDHTVTAWVLKDNFYFFQMFFWADGHGFTDAEMLQMVKIQADKIMTDEGQTE